MKRLLAVVLLVAACAGPDAGERSTCADDDRTGGRGLSDPRDDGERRDGCRIEGHVGHPRDRSRPIATPGSTSSAHSSRAWTGSPFPTGLAERVATLKALEAAFIDTVTACAEADLADVQALVEGDPLIGASRATRAAAMLLRTDLGLPTTEADSLGSFHYRRSVGSCRILHLAAHHHPGGLGVRRDRWGTGPPSWGRHGPRRYTRGTATHGRRPLDPGGSLLNPKFFRNGIVMLVLVVGTAALLFTWINSTTPANDDRLLAVPERRRGGQGRLGRPDRATRSTVKSNGDADRPTRSSSRAS